MDGGPDPVLIGRGETLEGERNPLSLPHPSLILRRSFEVSAEAIQAFFWLEGRGITLSPNKQL
jgi:hypothetical protein